MFKNKELIIFDMDGTLIDSVGVWNDIDICLIEKLGGVSCSAFDVQRQRDKALREHRGSESPYLEYCKDLKAKYSFDKTPDEIMKLRYDIAQEFLKEKIDYKPYADIFIKKLKEEGFSLVIASTTKKANMDVYINKNINIMKKAPLDKYFEKIYTREDVRTIKPDPEVFLKVLEDMKIESSKCLIFEDSLVGAEAARAAGIECVIVYDMYSDEDREKLEKLGKFNLSDYEEALNLLKKETK